MRAKHTALILTAGFLLIPTLTWSQGPGGRPDRGGFGSGQWGGPPGGGFGGGQPGGGGQWAGGGAQPPGGGGPGGEGGRMRMDPDRIFDMVARGKEVIKVDELDPFAKGMFDRFAKSFGLTGNEITRDQFKQAMTKVREMASTGQFGPMGMQPGGGPGFGGPGGLDPDRRTEEIFKRLDKNENGVLEFDEMSEALRAERDKYDTNHNGVIELDEFKAYIAARRGDRGPDGSDTGAGPRRPRNEEDADADPQPERKRPTVIRAGNMPRDFPYADLDKDQDGQIGLYEWKEAGRPIAQFLTMDLNNDGFLTVDEYYRWKRQGEEVAAKSGNQPGQFARWGVGMNPGMMAMNSNMTPGANRWGANGGPWGNSNNMMPGGPWGNSNNMMPGGPWGQSPWGQGRGPGGLNSMTMAMPGGDRGPGSFRMDRGPGGPGGFQGFNGDRGPGGFQGFNGDRGPGGPGGPGMNFRMNFAPGGDRGFGPQTGGYGPQTGGFAPPGGPQGPQAAVPGMNGPGGERGPRGFNGQGGERGPGGPGGERGQGGGRRGFGGDNGGGENTGGRGPGGFGGRRGGGGGGRGPGG